MRKDWINVGLSIVSTLAIFAIPAAAQNPKLQQKIAEVKEAAAQNKQALAQFTWQEQLTISLKGQQKKQEHFQVRLGPDGKPQKTSLDPPAQPSSDSGGGRRGRLKEHVIEKKTDEYKDYADQIKALIEQYVPPDKDKLQQAFAQGNVTLGTEPDSSGEYSLVISNYVKPGDKMSLVINKQQKNLSSISITSYLDNPKDAVEVSVQFASMPGGPNHVSTETINGVSKQLTIAIQNSNYQRL